MAFAVALLAACRAAPPPWSGAPPGQSAAPLAPAVERAPIQAALAAAIAADDPGQIVAAAVRLGAAGGDLARHEAEIATAIERADPADLDAAAAVMDPSRPPAPLLRARRARIAAHVAGPPASSVDRTLLAVLLPLTGRFAGLGAELRAAIEVAPAGGARRVYLDTQGDPAGAAAAVDRALAAGAVAILGPVGAREGDAAAARAVARGVPIALLAPGDGANPDAGVFRLVGSPEREARSAAAVAAELGAPTAAVLAPRDDVGAAAAAAFATAAAAAGIAVTARGDYDPTATDLEPDLKAFLGLDPVANPRLAQHLRRHGKAGWRSFSPDVGFSLLYIPDRYDRAALVAGFLPYWGVELRTVDFPDPEELRRKHGGRIPQVVQLLGSSGWNHPSLPTRGGAAVEGAYLVEPCPPRDDDFAARFRDRSGRDPSSAAREVHDAWRLAAAAHVGVDRPDPRAGWVHALRRARLEDGACEPAAVAADGQIDRAPILLGVEGGEIVEMPY